MRILRLLHDVEEGRWSELADAPDLTERAREARNRDDESCGLLFQGYVEMERTGAVTTIPRLLELMSDWDPTFWVASYGGALLTRSTDPRAREAGVGILERLAEGDADATWRFSFEEVRAAIAAGVPDLARRLVPDPSKYPRPKGRSDAEAAAAAIAELEGRWQEAADGYSAAVLLLEQLGFTGIKGAPLIGLGRSHLELGQPEQASASLEEARRISLGLGAAVRVEEIDALLATVG
jgi:hypothetical protein